MNFFRLAFVFALPTGLALACGGGSSGFGQPSGEQSGDNSAGSAGAANGEAGSNGLGGSGNQQTGNGGSGISGAGNVGPGNPMLLSVCQSICAKTVPLNCPNDDADCEAVCIDDFDEFPVECRQSALTWGACVGGRPSSDFLCDEDGESSPRETVCPPESEALVTCLIEAGGF